ncbi:HTH-type transcriptional regulator / antitoxin MqsA [Pseudoduganella namucuonensis]|uniref:HTH-type transcriptional regulator / antitoxin MqsA n=2 Tax=Pseudoduganella namucuonensis TaxID=1035707 RepID=A0A1I7LYL1_9BURK|nr:HTH-type transcriptional regulator / antitoxin MqsA [Pseudoduganella namucuonensis]
MVRQTKDMPYSYEGQTTVIPAVTGDFCPECGECMFSPKESDRIGAAMLEFNKQVKGARGA